MIQTLIHSTVNNNYYIYDDRSRLSLLIHPEIKKVYEQFRDVDPYYLKKYAYLKKKGFFTETVVPQFKKVSEIDVLDSIIQTTQIVFEVTDSCNLNCVYCGYGKMFQVTDKREYNNLHIENAIKLLKYVFNLKAKSCKNKLMIGFYGGEPLLNMNFIQQIIDVVSQLNTNKILDIEYSMTTNATLIYKHLDFLVANKIYLTISLDGDKNNHAYRIFGKGEKNSFDTVIRNIDLIQEKYVKYFNKYVNFISVLHDRNSVKNIYEFIYSRYNKIPAIIELNMADCKPDKKDVLDRMFQSKRESETIYQNECLNKIQKTQYETSFFHELVNFVKYYNINYYVLNKISLYNKKEKYLPTGTCLPFSLKIFLTVKNKLLPCEKINFRYSLGKVNDNVEIDFQEIAQRYNYYFEHALDICERCYCYKFFGSCIFHFVNMDKLDSEDLNCDYFQDQENFEKTLYEYFSFLEKYPNEFFSIIENLN